MNKIKTLKILIAIISFMLAFNIIIYLNQKLEPQQFSPPGSDCSVMIKGDPKENNQVVNTVLGPVTAYSYESEVAGIAYLISYADYPAQYNLSGVDPQKLLDASRDNMAKNVFGRITSETLISIDGYPGRSITVAADNGGAAKAKIYLVKNRLYMLIVATSSSRIYRNSVGEFLDSLKLEGN